jgi:hypothetical protein
MYKTEDCGLFIGLMTMPFGKEEPFLKNDIEQIFKKHQQQIVAHCRSDEPTAKVFRDYFYKPKSYGLFGSFDVAVFALVDDFSLATRYFHPYSPSAERREDYRSQNFAFNVISGVCPDLSCIDEREPALISRMEPLIKGKSAPCIGITSLKVNNALLIGTGGKMIDLILRQIQRLLARYREKDPSLQYIVNHSFSWHELTITFLADSYQVMKDIVFELRALNFGQLRAVAEAAQLTPLMEDIEEHCLLRIELDQEGESNVQQKIGEAHLFVHTNTILGYDLDLLFDEALELPPEENFGLYVRWDLKPGHITTFVRELKALLKEKNIELDWSKTQITAGRGDYALQLQQGSLAAFLQLMRAIKDAPIMGHVRRMTTTPEFAFEDNGNLPAFELDDHYLFHDGLSRYCFETDNIQELRAALKALKVPKILRERITNMYVMYNDAINDPVLYGYFIELKAFLIYITELVEALPKRKINTVQKVVDILEPPIAIFEFGYKNRFGQSYLLNEITDYNIEFNGGIQQLVSAYDGAYKSQTALLGERVGRSVAYVAGHPDTVSDSASVRLNYFHLYQPELFASAVTHEAANSLFDRLEFGSDLPDEELKRMLELHRGIRQQYKPGVHIDVFVFEAFRYFSIDLSAFYIGFNADFERFFYWQWAYFLQTAESYRTNGEVHPTILKGFLARMMLVDRFLNRPLPDEAASYFFNEESEVPFIKKPTKKLREAWQKSYRELDPKIRSLLDQQGEMESAFQAFFRYTKDYILGLVLDEFVRDAKQYTPKEQLESGRSGPTIDHLRKEIRETDRAMYDKIDDLVYQKDLSHLEVSQKREEQFFTFVRAARQQYIEHIAEDICEYFESGKVFSFHYYRRQPALAKVKQSFFYQALFNGYLRLIQKLCRNECQVRFRNAKGEVEKDEGFGSGLEIDPLGGMFSSDLKLRREYYRYRVLFLKSLWNLSQINKRNLFEDAKERERIGE